MSTYFNVSGLGAVIVLLREYANTTQDLNQDIVVCTLGAGWGSSSINITASHSTLSASSSLVNLTPAAESTLLSHIDNIQAFPSSLLVSTRK